VLIYKIASEALWLELQTQGQTLGSADDLRDGFIHLSTAEQLQGTFQKYFAAAHAAGTPLWLLSFDSSALPKASLRFEASRGGALFPHLYGSLLLSQMLAARLIESTFGEYDAKNLRS
jgi:uncharacterized protein (DUF952 family)